MPRRPLRVLFSIRSYWYLKFYQAVIVELATRGHRVCVIADRAAREEGGEWAAAMAALTATNDRITAGDPPKRVGDDWIDLTLWVRRSLDYLRFLQPQFADTPALRRRAESRAPRALVSLAAAPAPMRRAFEGLLRAADAALPISRVYTDYLREQAPDVVIVTPLVSLGSLQFDLLRAARAIGIPTAVAVGSWDHLSSKALIRILPDRLLVWNHTQRIEAVTYHGVPAARVAVTGAQCFDEWFERSPARTRDAFCAVVGLPADRPIVLYVCSALFDGSPSEAAFVRTWIEAVRSSPHAALRDASVLVRPHPKRGFEWDHVSLAGIPRVAVWPPRGQVPIDGTSKDDYFDSLFHSAAIVGLNTSALIEGGIIGRPVYTVLLPEFRENQEGTLHFRYLLEVEGGLLHAARGLDEHLDQLAGGVADSHGEAARQRAFVRAFVRPHGLDRPATPVFVDALESLAGERVAPAAAPVWTVPLRAALYPLARATRGTAVGTERLWRDARKQEKLRLRAEEKQARLQRRDVEKQEAEERRERALAAARREKQARTRTREEARAHDESRRRRRKRIAAWRARAASVYRRMIPRGEHSA